MTPRRAPTPHPSDDEIRGWFAGRLPTDWFTGPLEISTDRDEILVVGTVAAPELSDDESAETLAAAFAARIGGFREDTRARRMTIADEAQHRFGRKVSWGVACADQRVAFTTLSVPAMTRLRLPERQV